MAPWVRTVFINHLPKLLVMRRPIYPYNGMCFSEASRRFMMRTCNGLEMRDQIPPLPPEVALSNFDSSLLLDHHIMNICERNLESFNVNATCRLHGSPKTTLGAPISPLHRLQNLDLMDDMPLTYSKENHTTSSTFTTPIIEHNKMTPRRHQNHPHQLHTLSNDLSNASNHKDKLFGGIESSSINIAGGNSIGFNGNSSGPKTVTANACSSTCQTNTHHFSQHNKHSHQSFHHDRPPSQSQSKNIDDAGCLLRQRWQGCPELHKAMDGVNYIADHTKKEEESTKVKEDWKYVAMVLDRLFLWLFTIAVIVGTAGIILQAPTLYDTRVPIDIKISEIASATAKPHVSTPIL